MRRITNAIAALGIAVALALPATAALADDSTIGTAPAGPRTLSPDERAQIEAINAGFMAPSGFRNPGLQMLPPATFQDARTGYLYIPNVGWYDSRSGMIWVPTDGGHWMPSEQLGYRNVPPPLIGRVGSL